MTSRKGTTRREVFGSVFLGLSAVVAAARPAKVSPLEVTYYFLPG